MLNECTTVPGPSDLCGLALRTVWEVDADRTYDVPGEAARLSSRHLNPAGGTGLIALRAIQGAGRAVLETGVQEMPAQTLLLTDWQHIQRYHVTGDHWCFWWFEFTALGSPELPLHVVMHVPIDADDESHFRTIRSLLRSQQLAERRLASATFAWMLHRWVSRVEARQSDSPQRQAVLNVINMMHDRLGSRWAVPEMARAAHMSERSFRNAFHEITGQSPKGFYDGLRLAMATEQLRMGIHSQSQIAEMLGFSSSFHFSRAFRRHFGIPPSQVRRQGGR